MKFSKWTGFQDKSLWDWMDLLLVPLILGILGALVSVLEVYKLDEQYKQTILSDYFKEMTSLVFDTELLNDLRKAKKFDPRKELLGSKTLTNLEIFGKIKGEKFR